MKTAGHIPLGRSQPLPLQITTRGPLAVPTATPVHVVSDQAYADELLTALANEKRPPFWKDVLFLVGAFLDTIGKTALIGFLVIRWAIRRQWQRWF